MSSPISSLSVKTQNIPLAQAVGLPLDAAKRSLAMTGSLNYAVNAKDISRATLAK